MNSGSIQCSGNVCQISGYHSYRLSPDVKIRNQQETTISSMVVLTALTGIVELVPQSGGSLDIVALSEAQYFEYVQGNKMEPMVFGQPMKPMKPLRWVLNTGVPSNQPNITISTGI